MTAAFFFVSLTTVALIGAAIALVGRARRASRRGADELASRADTQRYLVENWMMVEQTARESGMTEEEIDRVRVNVLGGSG